jgi:hypothetical protein
MSAYSFNTEFKAFFMLSRVVVSLFVCFVIWLPCEFRFSKEKGEKNCQKSVLWMAKDSSEGEKFMCARSAGDDNNKRDERSCSLARLCLGTKALLDGLKRSFK